MLFTSFMVGSLILNGFLLDCSSFINCLRFLKLNDCFLLTRFPGIYPPDKQVRGTYVFDDVTSSSDSVVTCACLLFLIAMIGDMRTSSISSIFFGISGS